jgi:hypothetical protein
MPSAAAAPIEREQQLLDLGADMHALPRQRRDEMNKAG